MEEMLYKFIDEGKREHEEMRGVTTRGGKITTQNVHDEETNVQPKEPLKGDLDKPVESNEVLTNNQPQKTNEPLVLPSSKIQTPPFPKRLRKEKEEAQQKRFLENLKQLHINLPFIKALAQTPKCFAVLLNKLPSKEKDPGSFTIPCNVGKLHIDNALADLGASICLMPYTMYKKLGLGEPKATRMSIELADRCMTAIFHDMVEDFIEVFMDDFLVFGNSFDCCLANLDRMLARCEETNLVLNWEKFHFMVKEGIVLGHKISGAGIKVDRAKINVIAKLPYPTNVKGVRSFIGHAKFYQSKEDEKTRLIRWVLLLQGFDIEIKDKKGKRI
nr:reverse transcriptase domain-containing protein [Tanacetum cinerariifolium]